ncbi:MAG: biotin-dependent carboxyltransferase family protein [Chitinophagaceae bacterium]|nr:biotin-dependent carboxyltransferase family protein [Chitinophagaceae bacterium]
MNRVLHNRFTIEKAGLLDTIQDLGRYGQQRSGINPCGAMDGYALQLANALVGNLLEEAGLELHFPASVFRAEHSMLIALAGADMDARLNGEPIPLLHPVKLKKNDLLQFAALRSGYRCYMAIEGGLYVSEEGYSSSTNLKAGYGGHEGRALKKADVLKAYESTDAFLPSGVLPWTVDPVFETTTDHVRIIPGHEWERLSSQQQQDLLQQNFIIDKRSDRMGCRLAGDPLILSKSEELVSSAVNFGTIQLLPDGSPIVLMADHQTTGGYPRIAHVIKADLSKLAQKKPGDPVRFKLVTQEEAESSFIRQQEYLLQLSKVCRLKLSHLDHKL